MSPKYFFRVVRFSEACKFKELFPHSLWIEIAYRFGYYAQMHLLVIFVILRELIRVWLMNGQFYILLNSIP